MNALIRSLSRGNLRTPPTISPVSSTDSSYDYENDSFLADKPSTEELREILSDPQRTAAFKRFLDTEFCTEALLFWIDAEHYRKSDNILYDTKTEAKAIFDKYLTLESEHQINIDVDILRRITEKISSPDRNIFIEAQEYIFDLLRTDSFRKFRKSSIFGSDIHGDITIDHSPKTTRKFQELNTTHIYDGEDIKCDVWYLSATLLNMLLKLFKKHAFNLKSLYIENQKVRELFNIVSDLDYNRFVTATSQLQKVRLTNMTHKEKLVFFLNIYNTLCLHALLEFDAPLTFHQKMDFSKKAMYKIGNEKYSLMDIEHSILRAPMSRPSVLGMRLAISKINKGDPRLQHALTSPEPLLNFVMYNMTKESPLVTVYTPEMIGVKMALLTTEYLEREIEKSGFEGYGAKPLIKLPKFVSWFINDFAASGKEREMMNYLITYFPEELKTRVKFFGGNVKIRFKDANWNGIGGYMGSSFYDPQLAENEIKKEHIGSLKIQLNDLEKLFDDATRREDKNQMNKLKPQIEDLNKRLEVVL